MAESLEKKPSPVNLMEVVSHMALGQAIGLGSSLGIFDMMEKFETGKTCGEIAEAGVWKPRYIQEWLNLMVCSEIVLYNPKDKTYYLRDEFRSSLSASGKSNSLGCMFEMLNVFAEPLFEVKSCFPLAGPLGVPYASYTHFREWRRKFLDITLEWKYLEQIYKNVPGLVDKLESGIEVCDAGCSTGDHIILTAQNYLKSNFLGFDILEEPLDTGRQSCQDKNVTNVRFEVQNGCSLPQSWQNRFDLVVTFDVVHDVPFSKQYLSELFRIVKPGGVFIMGEIRAHTDVTKDIGNRLMQTLYGASLLHCLPISLSVEGSEGLGTCWGMAKQRQYLLQAGFQSILQIDVPDPMNCFFAACKPETLS